MTTSGEMGTRIARSMGVPAAGVAAAYTLARYYLYGGLATIWLIGLGIVLAAAWLGTFAAFERGWLGFLAALALLCYALSTFFTLGSRALAERGHTDTCRVLEVTERVVKNYDPPYQPPQFPPPVPLPPPVPPRFDLAEGQGASSYTEYVYRLECPGGVPDEMTTDAPVAQPGDLIVVRWDPLFKIPPMPAAQAWEEGWSGWVVAGSGAAAVLLGALDAALYALDIRRWARPRSARRPFRAR